MGNHTWCVFLMTVRPPSEPGAQTAPRCSSWEIEEEQGRAAHQRAHLYHPGCCSALVLQPFTRRTVDRALGDGWWRTSNV